MPGFARHLSLLLLFFIAACGSKSPTNPSPSPSTTATRVIALSGAMDFGAIQVGQSFAANLNIRNNGTSPLTVSGITGSNGITAVLKADWTSGSIAPNASQDVRMTFSPTAASGYSGTLTVNGDQTGGTNTINFSGTGTLQGLPIFTRSGTGDQVFDVPAYVTRLRVQASTSTTCQNFVVKVRGSLIVNVILGTCSVADARTIDNTYAITGGGTVETQISTGINWTFTEVR